MVDDDINRRWQSNAKSKNNGNRSVVAELRTALRASAERWPLCGWQIDAGLKPREGNNRTTAGTKATTTAKAKYRGSSLRSEWRPRELRSRTMTTGVAVRIMIEVVEAGMMIDPGSFDQNDDRELCSRMMSMGVAVRMMTKEDAVRNTTERLCFERDVEG
jgi:hypothetical protein